MTVSIVAVLLLLCHIANGDHELSNIAQGKETMSSSTFVYPRASLTASSNLAVDGNTEAGFISGRTCFSTAYEDYRPYWVVDLGATYNIDSVKITNRGDCCAERLHDVSVNIFQTYTPFPNNKNTQLCGNIKGNVAAGDVVTMTCPQDTKGRFVAITKHNIRGRSDVLTLCEVQIMGEKFVDMTEAYILEVANVLDRKVLAPVPEIKAMLDTEAEPANNTVAMN